MKGYKIYDKETKQWKQEKYWTEDVDKAKVYRTIGIARTGIFIPYGLDDEFDYVKRFEFVEFEMIETKRVSYYGSLSKKYWLDKISKNKLTPVQIVQLKKLGHLKEQK
jgi:hypothetical protein